MPEIGYALSSEEHAPNDLVEYAVRAESAGFDFASISDHFHPWTDNQGHSPFVWGVLGAIAHRTERLRLGTGVSCPLIRTHPAIVAHASATIASMIPERFYLGVGTGENLNEHITGERWPAALERLDMLEEAVQIIRELWRGELTSHSGKYYRLVEARIYDAPTPTPQIMIAASGRKATELAARAGDGLIATSPDAEQLATFDKAGGKNKPRIGMAHVCWAPDERTAKKNVLHYWPNAMLEGELGQELPLPRQFEAAVAKYDEEDLDDSAYGPDPAAHIRVIEEYIDAGFDQVYVHQIGPDQHGFFEFYEKEVLPYFDEVFGRA